MKVAATARPRPRAGARAKPDRGQPAAPTTAPTVLGGLPDGLRAELVEELNKIERNFREGRWEPASLDGGRLCEIVYSIVHGQLSGKMPKQASKPPNMVKAILDLEHFPATAGPRSMRVTIPRVLLGVLDIRNDRDIGHVNSEVPSNHMDAAYVVNAAKWLVAEMVRIFHRVSTHEATAFVDALIQRETPAVWEVAGTKRVMVLGLSARDRTLLVLHATPGPVKIADLRRWVEYANPTEFRLKIVVPLHRELMLHLDAKAGVVYLSPAGIRYVEAYLRRRLA